MLQTPAAQFGAIITLLVCGLALVTGGRQERIAGMAFGGCAGLAILAQGLFPAQMEAIILGLDLLCLIVFLSLCWKAPHPWPIWAFAAQLLAVSAEVARMQHIAPQSGVGKWAYLTVVMSSGYVVLGVLLVGTLAAIRARRVTASKNANKIPEIG